MNTELLTLADIEGVIITKCGALTAAGDRCTLAPKPHKLHAAWRGWAHGVVIWGQRDVVKPKVTVQSVEIITGVDYTITTTGDGQTTVMPV